MQYIKKILIKDTIVQVTKIGIESKQSTPPTYQKIQLIKNKSNTLKKKKIKFYNLKNP